MSPGSTIVAISTPPGRGGIGIVRLSGADSRHITEQLVRFTEGSTWEPWKARLGRLLDESGAVIDEVVVTWFAAPKSYTAEDVVEVACHGSPVVLQHCVARACQFGARIAEPGEFTLRAFLHGRLDLPRAEAVRDLIEATTLYQARIAAQQTHGSVSRRIGPLKEQLLTLISLLEAGIDFAEDDVSVASDEEILERLAPVKAGISKLEASFAYGRLVHNGFTLAIAGRPNVGKSSLFNCLLQQDRAIVTDIPGTTRDLISESASIRGIPVRFVDTAGIRTSSDTIEALGIERTHQAMADADLTLLVFDLSVPLFAEDRELIARVREQGRYLLVGNKRDLPQAAALTEPYLAVSAISGEGIEELRGRIVDAVNPVGDFRVEDGFLTSLRHAQLLKESLLALEKAEGAVTERIPHEMLLIDLYAALRPIDAITGATTADDILNRIFATFCIGK